MNALNSVLVASILLGQGAVAQIAQKNTPVNAAPVFVPMPQDIQCSIQGISFQSTVGKNGELVGTGGSVGGVYCSISGSGSAQKTEIPLTSAEINAGMLRTKAFGNLKISPVNSINSSEIHIAIRRDKLQSLREFLQKTETENKNIEVLISQLSSSRAIEQAKAAVALASLGQRASVAVPDLKRVLIDNSSQLNLVWAGPGMEHGEGRPTSPGREAAKALAKLGAPGREALLDSLRADNDSVRLNAALALGNELKDPRAIPELLAFIEANASSPDESEAAGALTWMGRPSGPALTAAFSSKEAIVRDIAVIGLTEVAAEDSIDLFITAARDDPDFRVREDAVRALAKLKGAKALLGIEPALKDENFYVRCAAMLALSNVKDSTAREALDSAIKIEKNHLILENCH